MDAPLVHVVITCMLVDGELEEGTGYSRIGEVWSSGQRWCPSIILHGNNWGTEVIVFLS